MCGVARHSKWRCHSFVSCAWHLSHFCGFMFMTSGFSYDRRRCLMPRNGAAIPWHQAPCIWATLSVFARLVEIACGCRTPAQAAPVHCLMMLTADKNRRCDPAGRRTIRRNGTCHFKLRATPHAARRRRFAAAIFRLMSGLGCLIQRFRPGILDHAVG